MLDEEDSSEEDKRLVEQKYQEFWKDIVENPDGTLNIEQVKKELSDYSMVMDIASKVYCSITRGRISKPNTNADCIIQVVEDLQQDDTQKAIKEERAAWENESQLCSVAST